MQAILGMTNEKKISEPIKPIPQGEAKTFPGIQSAKVYGSLLSLLDQKKKEAEIRRMAEEQKRKSDELANQQNFANLIANYQNQIHLNQNSQQNQLLPTNQVPLSPNYNQPQISSQNIRPVIDSIQQYIDYQNTHNTQTTQTQEFIPQVPANNQINNQPQTTYIPIPVSRMSDTDLRQILQYAESLEKRMIDIEKQIELNDRENEQKKTQQNRRVTFADEIRNENEPPRRSERNPSIESQRTERPINSSPVPSPQRRIIQEERPVSPRAVQVSQPVPVDRVRYSPPRTVIQRPSAVNLLSQRQPYQIIRHAPVLVEETVRYEKPLYAYDYLPVSTVSQEPVVSTSYEPVVVEERQVVRSQLGNPSNRYYETGRVSNSRPTASQVYRTGEIPYSSVL